MRWGRLVLAGDAAHTVPPTGAKGLNLAINDVLILHECLVEALGQGAAPMRSTRTVHGPFDRIWKSQNFSYWMTQMLHTPSGRRELRPQAPTRRTQRRRVIDGRSDLPRRVLHRLAGPSSPVALEHLVGRRHVGGRGGPTLAQGRGATSTLGGSGDGSGCVERLMMENVTAPTASTATPPPTRAAACGGAWCGGPPATSAGGWRRPPGRRRARPAMASCAAARSLRSWLLILPRR